MSFTVFLSNAGMHDVCAKTGVVVAAFGDDRCGILTPPEWCWGGIFHANTVAMRLGVPAGAS